MDVSVQERRMSLWTEYDIAAPGQNLHAKKKMFSLFSKISLETEDGQPLATLQGQFSVLRNRFEFDLADGRVGHFECVDRLRSVYECRVGEEVLTLYEHRGLKRSVFAGERQIAAYTKNRMTIGKGHRYDIRMDADADLVLIVSMVVALSVSEDNDQEQNAVTVDFGKIGPQGREFDADWEPR